MYVTIRHTFYYRDEEPIADHIDRFVMEFLTHHQGFADINAFMLDPGHYFSLMHDHPVFCLSFDTVIEDEDPLSVYKDDPKIRDLIDQGKDGHLADFYLYDDYHIDIIHETD